MPLALRALATAVRESGIPLHEVGAPLGLDARHVALAENLSELPVATLVDIAERVGLPLSILFGEEAEVDITSDEDVMTLGACLAGRSDGIGVATLAAVLGWDLDRIRVTTGHLHEKLRALGLGVCCDDLCLRIACRPGVIDETGRSRSNVHAHLGERSKPTSPRWSGPCGSSVIRPAGF